MFAWRRIFSATDGYTFARASKVAVVDQAEEVLGAPLRSQRGTVPGELVDAVGPIPEQADSCSRIISAVRPPGQVNSGLPTHVNSGVPTAARGANTSARYTEKSCARPSPLA